MLLTFSTSIIDDIGVRCEANPLEDPRKLVFTSEQIHKRTLFKPDHFRKVNFCFDISLNIILCKVYQYYG